MNKTFKNPVPTVDIIIELKSDGGDYPEGGKTPLRIVLIERKNPPYGWAIPGGFVDRGETLEEAAVREAFEETSLKVGLKAQMRAYSDPKRDPRMHTISVVFVAEAVGAPKARDDAKAIGIFSEDNLPKDMAFDHARILKDYFRWKKEGWKAFEF
ncbi:MAG: NUDIX hydrolase [Deltaproteobacteria bacterium]|nr:NUDIX hydrolase [Deltaproteobacteria bacterium]